MVLKHRSWDVIALDFLALCALLASLESIAECGPLSLESWQPIVRTSKAEKYWLIKDIYLTPGSAYTQKTSFDHNMNEAINLVFLPKDERNHYVAVSKWIDPSGQEYRAIRTTYDLQREGSTGEDRDKKGTTRIHTVSTRGLVSHKPGNVESVPVFE